ncbi:MAG: neutral zinc metallopeptidase [Chloroflexota bacterium]|nr:neutral zinc metallopeptidase [Chloroflexota bacterium]MDQ5864954.1 neutral zinc metallopeptidase [Chloroflexota bacterium]
MSFNDQSRLDPSQVEDRRGRRGGGGAGLAIGGGGLGVVVLVVALLLGVDPTQLGSPAAPPPSMATESAGSTSSLEEQCRTGADANARADCRIVGFVNSIQSFWTEEFARRESRYTPAKLVLFTDATQAACGYASAAVGPFYCPEDRQVYMDLSFFQELSTRFGAQGGAFAEAYVVAHEYGHHVQNLTGVLDELAGVQDTGPTSAAVQTELQADCLAGLWMHHATGTGYLTEVTEEEIAQSLDAAAAVGDDRIQRESQGYVSPESWTHGSSEQRQRALVDGLQSGELETCSTPGWTP